MANGDEQAGDPFADLTLDEEFIRAARKHEPAAAVRTDRAARARASHAELEAQRRRDRNAHRPHRRAVRSLRRWRTYAPATAVLAVLVGVAWSQGSSGPGTPAWLSGPQVTLTVGGGERPTPQAAVSDVPLGAPTDTAPGGGRHLFLATQPDSAEPVTYDPCRPIAVVVNDRTAPPGAHGVITDALADVAAITALRFDVEGATDEVPVSDRPAFQPDRYGDRWAPVLIAWSDPAELADLRGNVAGIGGSTRLSGDGLAAEVYVSGLVALDGPQAADMLDRPDGRSQVQAVVLHELGHLVGLAHVDDPGQLMHAEGRPGIVSPQAGDVAGLAALGQGPCLPEL